MVSPILVFAVLGPILGIWLIIKFLKILWLKGFLLGGLIGFFLSLILMFIGISRIFCGSNGDCQFGYALFSMNASWIIGAIIGLIWGIRKQRKIASAEITN